jgi:uncharacterized protein
MHNKYAHMVAFILLIVGGLNWGLTALGYNVVAMILGSMPMVEQVVYILVGLSAIYMIATHKATCTMCKGGSAPM